MKMLFAGILMLTSLASFASIECFEHMAEGDRKIEQLCVDLDQEKYYQEFNLVDEYGHPWPVATKRSYKKNKIIADKVCQIMGMTESDSFLSGRCSWESATVKLDGNYGSVRFGRGPRCLRAVECI